MLGLDGFNDRQIAEHQGVTRAAVYATRKMTSARFEVFLVLEALRRAVA